jgi:hypothetical protein
LALDFGPSEAEGAAEVEAVEDAEDAEDAAEAAEEEAEGSEAAAEEAAEDHSNNAIEIMTSDDDGDGDSGSEVGLGGYCRHQDYAVYPSVVGGNAT